MSEKRITMEDIRAAGTPEEKAELGRKMAQQNAEMTERGRLELSVPLRDGEREFTGLDYDFTKLNGMEYAEALDSGADEKNRNSFKINAKQALYLFCAAAAKCQNGILPNDVRDQLDVKDTMAAVNIATLFFTAASRAASFRISSM